MQNRKWSNSELLDMIENEGFDYFVLYYGPPAPEQLEDQTLAPLWADMLALSVDWREITQKIEKHLEDNE